MDAAQELFFKKGFDNVSMRAIASRIGYSPGAIYRYFKNKKEILSVLRHDAFGRYLAELQRVEPNVPPLKRVRRKLTVYYQLAIAEPDIFDLMFNMGPSTVALGGKWATRPREMFQLFCDDVSACQEEGLFQGQDVNTVVIALWSAIHGYATLTVKERLSAHLLEFDPEKQGELLVDFLLKDA